MYLVFDIGGTAIKYCYFDTNGKMFDKNEFLSTTLTNLNLFISRLSEIYFKSNYQIDGIALSCPGIINSKKGVIEKITAYPFLKGVNLKNLLSKACNGVKVTIEKGADLFSAWAENIPGIYGEGESVKEVKEDILKAIALFKEHNDEKNIPEELKGDYDIEWHFDVQSFLQYYSGIFTKAALERITGINQKQLGHYASGLKKPRKAQVEKIETALHNFFDDMRMVHLV